MDEIISQMEDWAREMELMLSPPILIREVYIPNVNLSCTYCDTPVSNTWAMEITKRGQDRIGLKKTVEIGHILCTSSRWPDANSQKIAYLAPYRANRR